MLKRQHLKWILMALGALLWVFIVLSLESSRQKITGEDTTSQVIIDPGPDSVVLNLRLKEIKKIGNRTIYYLELTND